jgi:hypothetical protein
MQILNVESICERERERDPEARAHSLVFLQWQTRLRIDALSLGAAKELIVSGEAVLGRERGVYVRACV